MRTFKLLYHYFKTCSHEFILILILPILVTPHLSYAVLFLLFILRSLLSSSLSKAQHSDSYMTVSLMVTLYTCSLSDIRKWFPWPVAISSIASWSILYNLPRHCSVLLNLFIKFYGYIYRYHYRFIGISTKYRRLLEISSMWTDPIPGPTQIEIPLKWIH